MPRKKATYGNGRHFVPVPYSLINSKAYTALSYSSRAALLYFWAKVKVPLRDPRRYTTIFSLTYTEASKYGFSKRTFSRVIQDIMRHGFIDPVKRGGLRGMQRSDSQFTLSERWQSFGSPDFKVIEWRQFIDE